MNNLAGCELDKGTKVARDELEFAGVDVLELPDSMTTRGVMSTRATRQSDRRCASDRSCSTTSYTAGDTTSCSEACAALASSKSLHLKKTMPTGALAWSRSRSHRANRRKKTSFACVAASRKCLPSRR